MKYREIIYIVLILGCIGFTAWVKLSVPKIGYIKTEVVLENYAGMKDASKKYEQKRAEWKSAMDTLSNELRLEINNYILDSAAYTKTEKRDKKEKIRRLRQNMQVLNQKIKQQAEGLDVEMTMEVLEQVNTYLKQYGDEQGYDMIFGTMDKGTVVYGTPPLDLTNEVLEGLNKYYLGE